jgi:S-adenosylmethionine hydrolase
MTDFGEDDFFVASLKGVIAKINPWELYSIFFL